jgi:hypothetical protein
MTQRDRTLEALLRENRAFKPPSQDGLLIRMEEAS